MRAEIKDFHSPDLDWASEVPLDGESFSVLLQLFIGAVGEDGADSFDIILCTPEYLRQRVSEWGIFDGLHHLIVNSFNREQIEKYLQKRVSSLEADTWKLLAQKLGQLGRWEYEE